MTPSGEMGWAVVGLGRIADTEVAPAISSLDNGRLVAVVSRDQGKADDFAARHGAQRGTTSFAEVLQSDDVDAVYIATPNALHAEQAIAAARAGKHVLSDKPIATNVADAERILQECDKAGVRFGVMFQTRSYEGMTEVRQLVAEGRIGKVVIAQVEMSPGRTLLGGWRTDPTLAGVGTMNNIGVHAYDLLRYLLGAEVSEATVLLGVEPGFELDTTALALLRFTNDTLAYVNANQSVPHFRPDLALYGSEGRVLGYNVTRPNLKGRYEIITGDGETTREADTSGGFRVTLANFVTAVRAGEDPSPSGVDGLRSVQLTEAMSRSAAEGRTVRLEP